MATTKTARRWMWDDEVQANNELLKTGQSLSFSTSQNFNLSRFSCVEHQIKLAELRVPGTKTT